MYVPLWGTLAACQRLFTRKLLKVFFRVRLNSSQLKMCNLQRYKKTKTKYNLGKHTPGDNVIRSDLYKGVWTFTGTVLLLWRFKKGAAPQSCWFESKDRMVWDVGFPKFELPSTELRPVFYHLFIHSSDKKKNQQELCGVGDLRDNIPSQCEGETLKQPSSHSEL